MRTQYDFSTMRGKRSLTQVLSVGQLGRVPSQYLKSSHEFLLALTEESEVLPEKSLYVALQDLIK